MDLVLAVGLVIGLFLALFFSAGVGITHGLEQRAFERRVCGLFTPEAHRIEGERLIREALRTQHPNYEKYLRDQAYAHFRTADILENGPYRGLDFRDVLR